MKWIIAIPIVVVAIIIVLIVLPLTHSKKYDLFVEAIVEKNGQREVKRVVLQNTGLEPLTNLIINYGDGKKDSLPLLNPGQKVFLSPPEGSLNNVTISTEQGIQITKQYEEPIGLVPPGYSG